MVQTFKTWRLTGRAATNKHAKQKGEGDGDTPLHHTPEQKPRPGCGSGLATPQLP